MPFEKQKIRAIRSLQLAVITAIATVFATAGLLMTMNFSRAAYLGNPNESNKIDSFFENYLVHKVADGEPLFTESGVNYKVAGAIMEILDEINPIRENYWPALGTVRAEGDRFYERTAESMSNWVLRANGVANDRSKSGGVFVKLFDSSTATGVAREIADQWFQIVYTSGADADSSVISFYMAEPYKSAAFNSTTSYTGYSESVMRNVELAGAYEALMGAFQGLDELVVAPSASLASSWQSQAFQTGGTGAAAGSGQSSLAQGVSGFATQNGMNSQGVNATAESFMEDKLWLPSAYETLFMGTGKDEPVTYGQVSNYDNEKSELSNSERTGLWRLNGFDRAFKNTKAQYSWLRSGNISGSARSIYRDGVGSSSSTNTSETVGIRPALHISFDDILSKTDINASITKYSEKTAADITVITAGGKKTGESVNAVSFWNTELFFDASLGYFVNELKIGAVDITDKIGLGEQTIPDVVTYSASYVDESKKVVKLMLSDFGSSLIGDKAITASTFIKTYEIKYNNLKESLPPIAMEYTIESDTFDLQPPSGIVEGWTFKQWRLGSLEGEVITAIPVGSSGDKALFAEWSVAQYEITFDTNGGNDVRSIFAEHLSSIAELEPATPEKEGHSFAGWYMDNGSFKYKFEFDSSAVMPSWGMTLYAKWTVNPYTITFDVNGGVPIEQIELDFGELVSWPSEVLWTLGENPLKRFGGWYRDAGCTIPFDTAVVTAMPAEHLTLYANWVGIDYITLSYDTDGGTIIAHKSLEKGTAPATLRPANPRKTGYTFDKEQMGGWYADAEFKVLFDFNSIMTTDIIIYAKFTVNSHTVDFVTNTANADAVIYKEYNYNEIIVCLSELLTKDGHEFDDWYTSADFSDKYVFGSAMPDNNVTIYARWVPSKDGLRAALAIAEAVVVVGTEEYYTSETLGNLQVAIADARAAAVDSADVTATYIDKVIMDLTTASAGLKFDITHLTNNLITPPDASKYTSVSYKNYIDTYDAAVVYIKDGFYTLAGIQVLEQRLKSAYEVLENSLNYFAENPIDKSAIYSLIQLANAIKDGKNNDYANTDAFIENVLGSGGLSEIFENKYATQAAVDAAENAAKELLTFDTSRFVDEYNNIVSLVDDSKTSYTEKSWSSYIEALENAQNILSSSTATPESIKQALRDLDNARKALITEKKTDMSLYIILVSILLIVGGIIALVYTQKKYNKYNKVLNKIRLSK